MSSDFAGELLFCDFAFSRRIFEFFGKPADLKPYVEAALEAFGPDRCMYGSDWPVCELAGSYEQVHGALTEVLGPLSDDETHAIFEGTARRFYGIST